MKVLIAGVGNIFMGDDGFGCEVAAELARAPLPAGVDVVDFGIRGMDLCYALTDGYDAAVLVDTTERGEPPGTVYVIAPDIDTIDADAADTDPALVALHEMDPARVLRLVASLGNRRPQIRIVACEPASFGGEQGHMGLSAPVRQAIPRAVADVHDIVRAWCENANAGEGEAAPNHQMKPAMFGELL